MSQQKFKIQVLASFIKITDMYFITRNINIGEGLVVGYAGNQYQWCQFLKAAVTKISILVAIVFIQQL